MMPFFGAQEEKSVDAPIEVFVSCVRARKSEDLPLRCLLLSPLPLDLESDDKEELVLRLIS